MPTKTNILSHITYATEWPFVQAAYIASVTVDGETFEKPTERTFSSPAVLAAVAALEAAILSELGLPSGDATTPTPVTTMRVVNDDKRRKRAAAEWDKANPSAEARYDENGVRVDAPPEIRGVPGA